MTQIHRCNICRSGDIEVVKVGKCNECGGYDTQSICNHTRFIIKGSNPIGKCTCLDCNETVHVSDALNNLGAELRMLIKETERCLTNLKATR